jgi:hypothetical protein
MMLGGPAIGTEPGAVATGLRIQLECWTRSLETFARIAKRFFGTDALNFPAAKFFKSALSFSKPRAD